MITALAFCPQAPVLVPDLARGAAGELAELRAACRTAIGRLAAPHRQLVVLGQGLANEPFGAVSRGSFAGFGLALQVPLGADGPGPTDLPPALAVGAWLLRDALGPDCGAVGYSVADPVTAAGDWSDHGADVGVLVMGDGSARRTRKAPGYLDERAEQFDRDLAGALASGQADRLHVAGTALAAELLVGCTGAYELLARSLGPAVHDAELLYDDAPYGVGYFVASWSVPGSSVRG